MVKRFSVLCGGLALAAVSLVSCGGDGKPTPTTTTAPPATTTTTTTPPATLTLTPPTGKVGTVVALSVTGAVPGESLTFTITSPKGKVFTGTPKVVDPTGAASGTYNTSGDSVGTFLVQALGSSGTAVAGNFTTVG